MINILDVRLEDFLKVVRRKKIIAVGAGRKMVPFFDRHELWEKIAAIIDGDLQKAGKTFEHGKVSFTVQGYDFLPGQYDPGSTVLLISAYLSVTDIINMLDSIEAIDGADCYIAPLMEENFEDHAVCYTKGTPLIPKTLHYFWFGKKPIPQHLQEYMKSWKRLLPNYEIVRWDESNYDVSGNRYTKEAYESGKYGFVPDYARLDVLYHHGGIYLDTDVEVVRSFDDLLMDRAFMGFFDKNGVALGAGFGCVKGNDLIKLMMDYYEDKSFYNKDGSLNLTTCIEYQYPVLKQYGFKMDNSQQCINGNMVYPVQVFNPEAKMGVHTHYTEDTHSVHRSEISYENDAVKSYFAKRSSILDGRGGRTV